MNRLLLALLGWALCAAPAAASTALATSVEELARASDAVVRGQVVGQQARRSPDGGRIYTFVEVLVSARWKGEAPERLWVRTPGGVVGELGQRVLGAATFVDGEEIAVFVKRDPSGTHQVVGLSQGKFSLSEGRARNDTRGFQLLSRPVAQGERLAEEMPADELERRVRSAR